MGGILSKSAVISLLVLQRSESGPPSKKDHYALPHSTDSARFLERGTRTNQPVTDQYGTSLPPCRLHLTVHRLDVHPRLNRRTMDRATHQHNSPQGKQLCINVTLLWLLCTQGVHIEMFYFTRLFVCLKAGGNFFSIECCAFSRIYSRPSYR